MKTISVVVPCYNEQENISKFLKEFDQVKQDLNLLANIEFIFVDDGSSDETLNIIKNFSMDDGSVHYISFTRNFGKESALYAGLEHAKGDYITVMDVDLQDPPHLLSDMFDIISTGEYDCVATRRITRKGEPKIRTFFAKKFYSIINKISDTEIVDGARDYRIMTRQMVDSILSLKEYNRFSKGIFCWVGYRTKWLEYENVERVSGETKWSFKKLFIYSIEGITAFSTAPLILSSLMGIIFCFIAFLYMLIIIIKTLLWGDPVAGYPSMICVIIFIGGIQLLCIGILGQYLSKTYQETKRRPIYIYREKSE